MEEWGGSIKIKALDFSQQIEFEKCKKQITDDSELILLMLKMCIVDENNNAIFDDSTISTLRHKNSNSLFKLFKECLEINALDEKSVDNTAKN